MVERARIRDLLRSGFTAKRSSGHIGVPWALINSQHVKRGLIDQWDRDRGQNCQIFRIVHFPPDKELYRDWKFAIPSQRCYGAMTCYSHFALGRFSSCSGPVKDLAMRYLSSLFFALARSAGSVIHSGMMRFVWRPAHRSFASACDPGSGRNRFPIFIA